MELTPARMLKPGELLVAIDKVIRLDEIDYAIPGNTVVITGHNNGTGEPLTSSLRWDEHIWVDKPYKLTIEDAEGVQGRIEVEVAVPPSTTNPWFSEEPHGWIYRHRIYNAQDELLEDALGPTGPETEQLPDTRKAMGTLLGFLGAAAEAQRSVEAGHDSENKDLFTAETMEWAAENSGAIGLAELELTEQVPERGLE